MSTERKGAAFFDVDETLIDVKSMFSFLRFHLRRRGEAEGAYEAAAGALHSAAARGANRQSVNRAYYRLFAGEDAGALAAAGEEWFAQELQRGLFVPEIMAELLVHRAAGDFVVLVSGSFFACLDPIAEHVGADWAFGTRPVVRDGKLTGEVVTPMIGAAKGRVASATAAVRGLDLAASSAYGDHISDLDLLRTVGRPVVVGDDPLLAAHAETYGWRRLTSRHAVAHAEKVGS